MSGSDVKKFSTSAQPEGAVAEGSRAFLYLRVSTGRQAEHDLSIPDQRNQISAWCAGRGWNVVTEFVEPGASATDDRRPEFQRMVERACNGDAEVDAIVVHSFSRFMRDSFGFEFYLRKLAKHGVRVVSITQDVREDDPAQLMMRKIIALFDEYQSKENAKHVLRAMKENARQGFWNGARPPFGYTTIEIERRADRKKKGLAIDPVEAELVRLVFQLFLYGDGSSGPLGVKAIAVWLNEHGHRTRSGANWGTGPIHAMLTNSAYAGSARFNRMDSRTRKRKSEGDHVIFQCPAIIDPPVFERVQERLRERNPRVTPPRVVSGPVLLSGLAHCATCGGAMTLRTGTSRTGKVHRYYTCSTCARQGKSACAGRSIRMDKLDALVTNHVLDRILEPKRLEAVLASLASRRSDRSIAVSDRIRELESNAADADQRLRRLYDVVESGLTDIDDILRDRIALLKKEREATSAALARAHGANRPPTHISSNQLQAFSDLMHEKLTRGEIPLRKAYLGSIIDRIDVDDGVIRIHGRKDVLEQAVLSDGCPVPPVRSFVRKWRARQDSNL